jgi:hypothetical protein
LQTAGQPPISCGPEIVRLQIDGAAPQPGCVRLRQFDGSTLNFRFAWNSQGSFNFILAGRGVPPHA